jgi:hypothetical protein
VKSRRKQAYPRSVLDQKALADAIDDVGISDTVKAMHVTGFYQALHRQHYPDLKIFVENYYKFEKDSMDNNNLDHKGDDADKDGSQCFDLESENRNESTSGRSYVVGNNRVKYNGIRHHRPLKNNISNKKNVNKIQLPKCFLEMLYDTKDLVTSTSTVVAVHNSVDKSTTKLIIRLHDDQLIESVIMRYSGSNRNSSGNGSTCTTAGGRASLCVSSQCGCAMGCTVRILSCYFLCERVLIRRV